MAKLSIVVFFVTLICGNAYSGPKVHEIWWEKNLGADVTYRTFDSWLGDVSSFQREAMRQQLVKQGYTSILDAACGLCIDYDGIRKAGIAIDYQGLDITPKLVELANQRGIPVVLGSIEQIPFEDQMFEIAYARHILEHLDYYEVAITELIRVAKREVFISFFIEPAQNEVVVLDQEVLLYHNYYNKERLERFVLKNPRVSSVQWTGGILQIYLN